MFQNSTALRNEVPHLTVVRKEKNKNSQAKLVYLKRAQLVYLKRMNNKPEILLPPVREQYIKVKKHDFL